MKRTPKTTHPYRLRGVRFTIEAAGFSHPQIEAEAVRFFKRYISREIIYSHQQALALAQGAAHFRDRVAEMGERAMLVAEMRGTMRWPDPFPTLRLVPLDTQSTRGLVLDAQQIADLYTYAFGSEPPAAPCDQFRIAVDAGEWGTGLYVWSEAYPQDCNRPLRAADPADHLNPVDKEEADRCRRENAAGEGSQ